VITNEIEESAAMGLNKDQVVKYVAEVVAKTLHVRVRYLI